MMLPTHLSTSSSARAPSRPVRGLACRRAVAALLAVSLVVVSCTTDPSAPDAGAPDTERAGTPETHAATTEPDPEAELEPDADHRSDVEPDAASDGVVIEGTFDVGGHELYMRCEGRGDPTIIYLHGSIEDTSVVPHRNGRPFQARLRDEHRVCVYDRRNLGWSDTVDAVQLPEDALNDLDNLLAAADIGPPYVLLGASFGGVLAYLYANRHPDDIVGLVLLDSMFPDEMALEERFPPEERYEAFDAEDENELPERISHYKVMHAAEQHIGDEPPVPLIYLASEQDRRDEPHVPGYNEEIYQLLERFVDRFAPGEIVWVYAPHFLEPAAPNEIEAALRQVIASAGTG